MLSGDVFPRDGVHLLGYFVHSEGLVDGDVYFRVFVSLQHELLEQSAFLLVEEDCVVVPCIVFSKFVRLSHLQWVLDVGLLDFVTMFIDVECPRHSMEVDLVGQSEVDVVVL